MVKQLWKKLTVLPLFRNRLRVVLCPDKVILLGVSAGFHRKVWVKAILPCVQILDVPSWQPAVDVLEHWLRNNEIAVDIEITLSNHFVRYVVMPFASQMNSHAEEQAWAKILVEEIYGDVAQQWQLTIGEGGYGDTKLVAALDSALFDKLTTLSKLRLRECIPHFIKAYNFFSKNITVGSGFFVVVEAHLMTILLFEDERFVDVRRVLCDGDMKLQLNSQLQRIILTSGLSVVKAQVHLYVIGNPELDLNHGDGVEIIKLSHGDFSGDDLEFEMAAL